MSHVRLALVGLGEAGCVLAEDMLTLRDVSLRLWDRDFARPGSKAARHLRELAGHEAVTVAPDAAGAARGCPLVLSLVTADQAIEAARSVLPGLGPGALFVDLNSVSPGTKTAISQLAHDAGSRFVEASIMSPITARRSASPILLSGPHAGAFLALGEALGLSNMRVVSEELGQASATKMCRSVIVKGIEALVSESLLTARHYGVEDTVIDSLDNLFPGLDWTEKSRYLIARTLEHGERRAAEMREVARTVKEAGYEPWMSEGCVKRQAWAPRFESALAGKTLAAMLDAIGAPATTDRECV